ncbi:hypothetical protein RvY_00941 [Ramazzottius varieornatus]|uniref:Uncharacterized protein n=1 Tax=Ramazzottius varieornatus TaxID=947166 RepID=A0A1D1UPX2_RAMVA|nr:hypothetical protein RvY_00941 [Ramazzottius varieornatus]
MVDIIVRNIMQNLWPYHWNFLLPEVPLDRNHQQCRIRFRCARLLSAHRVRFFQCVFRTRHKNLVSFRNEDVYCEYLDLALLIISSFFTNMGCRRSLVSGIFSALLTIGLVNSSPLRPVRQAGSESHGHTADPTSDAAKQEAQAASGATSGGRSGSVLNPDTPKTKRDLKTSGIGGSPSPTTSDNSGSGLVTGYAMDPSRSPGVTGSDVGYKTGTAADLQGSVGVHTMMGTSVGGSHNSDVAGKASMAAGDSGNTSAAAANGSSGQIGALDSSRSNNTGDIVGHGKSNSVGSANQSGTSGTGLRMATGKIGGQG